MKKNSKHTEKTKDKMSDKRKRRTIEEMGHQNNCSCFICRAKRKEPLKHTKNCKCFRCNRKSIIGKNNPNFVEKIIVKCQNCKMELSVTSHRAKRKYGVFCSKKCWYKYRKSNHIFEGDDNPKHKEKIKIICKHCGRKFKVHFCNKYKKFCSRKCYGEAQSKYYIKEKSSNWQNGISFEPYPLGWTKTFKEQIRYRDKYKCQICGMPEVENGRRLDVHHKDYDKMNIKPNNLISLCTKCHRKTNGNREKWKLFFKEKINGIISNQR